MQKPRSRRTGQEEATKKVAKRPAAKRRAVRKQMAAKAAINEPAWGAVYLDPAEFAEFEKCIQTPQKPTKSIVKGAEMIRRLYQQKR
jgi:predicted urease superfamily metal-dependent hydrolase